MAKKHKEAPSDAQVAIKWAVRVFVLGTLVLLLVLALMDYFAKKDAQATADAWLDRQHEEVAGEGLKQRELAALIKGRPTLRDGAVSDLQDPRLSQAVQVYQWKGIFRTYKVYVGLLPIGQPTIEDDIVETVEGPGGLADAE